MSSALPTACFDRTRCGLRPSQAAEFGRSRMRYYLIGVLSALLLGCSTSPTAPPSGAAPPWQHKGRTSYEARAPGHGFSNKYESAAGNIDVYVYDLRRSGWQSGVADPAFDKEFQSTIDEVKHYAGRGDYTDLQIGPVQDHVIAGQPFRTVSFHFVRRGRAMESLTFLTASGGKLLKYRMSFYAPPAFDIQAEARRFIEETAPELRRANSV
jgi:hypothetical protein